MRRFTAPRRGGRRLCMANRRLASHRQRAVSLEGLAGRKGDLAGGARLRRYGCGSQHVAWDDLSKVGRSGQLGSSRRASAPEQRHFRRRARRGPRLDGAQREESMGADLGVVHGRRRRPENGAGVAVSGAILRTIPSRFHRRP